MPTAEKNQPSGFILWLTLSPAWLGCAWLVSKVQWFWVHRPDLQFGWIVLLLSAYLIWEAWDTKPLARFGWNWCSLILAGSGLALLFVVQAYQAALGTMAASIMGLSVGTMLVVAGNLAYVFGPAGIRHFAFGFGFLLIALPMPSFIQSPLVSFLQGIITAVNVDLLNLSGIPARRVGNLIHLPNGTVGIDEACSGIRSLQSSIMATLFIGYLSLKNKSLQVILLGAGILLAILGNAGRSLFLSFTANTKGMTVVNEVHDAAGWWVLIFTAAGVMLVSWGFARLEKALNQAKLAASKD